MSAACILAVASGKGGVGKTLTAVNLGLCAVRAGMRTAIVDADPLSDIMAMLDQQYPQRELPAQLTDPAEQTFIAAPQFEIIFPQPKQNAVQVGRLIQSLLEEHRQWLDERYGMVIIDMPAGTGFENPFTYLAAVEALVLVTNPEPTAHVAAGAFLRQIKGLYQNKPIFLWHNKYLPQPIGRFSLDDVIGNYNNNVPETERLEDIDLIPIAYIPSDPTLDLAKADPPVLANLHRALNGILDALAEVALPMQSIPSDSPATGLISGFLRHAPSGQKPEETIAELEEYIVSTGSVPIPAEVKNILLAWFRQAEYSPLRRQIVVVQRLIQNRIANLESAVSPFAVPAVGGRQKTLEREIMKLFNFLKATQPRSGLKKLGGLLLFRYALLKLFTYPVALQLIAEIIPHRHEQGRRLRDRRTQILRLIVRDEEYRQYYLSVVKKLFPMLYVQLEHIATSFQLRPLLYSSQKGVLDQTLYLKLFNEAMYEIVNSGLGIITGFRFRPASRAFKEGYENLVKLLEDNA